MTPIRARNQNAPIHPEAPLKHSIQQPIKRRTSLTPAAIAVALVAPFVYAQDDHGDSTDTATAVEVGSSTAGTLTRGDEDYFRFDLAEASTVTVQTEGRTDTRGTLLDAGGGEIESDDDSGSRSNFRIERDATAGTYFVRVRGFSSSTTGDYTFTVTAASAPTAAPGNVQVGVGAGALTVSWDAISDSDAGSSAITGYVATAEPAAGGASSECRSDAAATACTIDGLPAGTTYSVTVAAENEAGAGPASEAVSATTPTAPTAAPDNVQVTAGAGTLTASWDAVAEADDGGSPITGYTAVATPPDDGASAQCSAAATETTCALTGLAAGTTFSVTVRADNAVGAGPASSPPVEATTPTVPAAPENVAAVPSLRHLAVSWDPVAEADDGGSPITGYVAAAVPDEGDGATCTADADGVGCTIEGLAPGTAYAVTASAVNAVGTGAASTPLDTATLPPTPPTAAPADVQATPGVTRLTVAWAAVAEADDGGSPITGYGASTASADGKSIGACSTDAETLGCTIDGLAPGVVHAVTVHATNALGDGVASVPVEAVPISRSYRFVGEQADDGAGWSLAAISAPGGGRSHLLIGAPFHTPGADRDGAGAAYLIAATDMVRADAADGSEDGTLLLRNVAAQPNSWKFVGEAAGDSAGWGIAPITDLDADGATDLAIGAPRSAAGGGDAGAVYLLASADFAAADAADGSADGVIDLGEAAKLAASWKVLGEAGAQIGTAVIDAGDVGGDGSGNLLLHARPDGGASVGAAYLLSLADLATADSADGTSDGIIGIGRAAAQTGSWEFVGTGLGGDAGRGVAAAGDVDGDGRADILLGAPHAAFEGRTASGAAYLAAGADLAAADSDSDGVIDVADLVGRPNSWSLAGERSFDLAGERVAAAGDVDGDGLADLIVGAPKHAYQGEIAGGAAYLVAAASLGAADAADSRTNGAISLANVAAQTGSWKFVGDDPSDEAGVMLASAGDADGDGLADLLIGTDANATYLISAVDLPAADAADGAADGVIDIGNVAAQPKSWKLVGTGQYFGSGLSLISAGDVDGDGVPDVMIGTARGADGGAFLVTAETLARLDAADGSVDGVVGFDAIVDPPAEDVYETAQVAVRVLGDGRVELADGGMLDCASAGQCETYAQLGTQVVLRALPDATAEFRKWTGCDSAAGDQCTVTVDASRSVRAYFLSTEPVQLFDHVVTFDAPRVDMIEDWNIDTGLMRLSSQADVSDIEPGTVIVSGVEDESKPFSSSFALRVEQVAVRPGAPTYLRIALASLSDIMASGTVLLERELTPENVVGLILPPGIEPGPMLNARGRFGPPVERADGRRLYRVEAATPTIDDRAHPALDRLVAPEGATELAKCIDFEASLDFSVISASGPLIICGGIAGYIQREWVVRLKRFYGEVELRAAVLPSITWSESIGDIGVKKTVKIEPPRHISVVFGKIPIATGVWIEPEVALAVTLEASMDPTATAELGVRLILSQGALVQVDYQKGKSMDYRLSLNPDSSEGVLASEIARMQSKHSSMPNANARRLETIASASVGVPQGGSVGLTIGPSFEFLLNGVAGPYVDFGPYARAQFRAPWAGSGCNFDYDVQVGLDANIGGKVEVFGRELLRVNKGWRWPIGNFNLDCLRGEDVSPPGSPASLSIDFDDYSGLAVLRWEPGQIDGRFSAADLMYRIHRSVSDPTLAWKGEAESYRNSDRTTFEDDSLLFFGRTHTYRVKACWRWHSGWDDASSCSDWSSEEVRITPQPDEVAPDRPRVRAHAKSTTVELSWPAVVDDRAGKVRYEVSEHLATPDGAWQEEAVRVWGSEESEHLIGFPP